MLELLIACAIVFRFVSASTFGKNAFNRQLFLAIAIIGSKARLDISSGCVMSCENERKTSSLPGLNWKLILRVGIIGERFNK